MIAAGSVTLSSYLFFGMSEKTGLKFIRFGELISHETNSSFLLWFQYSVSFRRSSAWNLKYKRFHFEMCLSRVRARTFRQVRKLWCYITLPFHRATQRAHLVEKTKDNKANNKPPSLYLMAHVRRQIIETELFEYPRWWFTKIIIGIPFAV